MQKDNGILLESGTNEFEIIEFLVDGRCYGINVAKVREVISHVKITPVIGSHHYIDGIFSLRDQIIPVINLSRCLEHNFGTLDGEESASLTGEQQEKQIIVCEINGDIISFNVNFVNQIHKVSWTQMEPVSSLAGSQMTVGIVKLNEKMIVLLDFEKIISDIDPSVNQRLSVIPAASGLEDIRRTKTIVIAEDSFTLRMLLERTLQTAGYHVLSNENGEEAWNKLTEMVSLAEPILKQVQLVITDIEMPQMDGHHLTKRIKEHPQLKELPVVIFSSMINPELKRKGEMLGAYAQITKPEIEQLIGIIDQCIL
ncbi:chemotaxis protein [Dehalobacter sp. DCM]|uniref:chemotaxis protein n=1 Tax=Dehalobacter sp. DCM TaxID=2907827 RepID=UPI003081EB83|nr:chemotaxis protein [Dehalobacter sp. DCM]